MARFRYGPGEWVELDDRILAHLQVVMLSKLRRSESFAFNWQEPDGSGRITIWIHPTADLRFQYSGSRAPELNRAWLEELSVLANSSSGLHVVPEPDPAAKEHVPAAKDAEERRRLAAVG